ncbi:MAG: SUMF1/EgtB/PvdO family nonheme iron enzyme [Armatimonadetes bacterium]|nr:SUMF1/EgtB/PvdO family nonheme iron enzyme [Akkermansiaceae bacterium]
MDEVSEESLFGEYLPKQCLAESASRRTWLAEQVSVGRMVLIEELKQEDMDKRDLFLADVRAKAAVEHPLMGSVYEASTEHGRCFFAQELLPGQTLEARSLAGVKLKAQRLAPVLRRIAEANIYLDSHAYATSPLGLDSIHVDEQGVMRLKNLAVAGERVADHSLRDILILGEKLKILVNLDYPGATRFLTLLAWMRGEEVPVPLGWQQIRDYCEQIEQQLTEPSNLASPPTSALRPGKNKSLIWLIALGLAGAAVIFLSFPKKKTSAPPTFQKPGWVLVDGGQYITPDGLKIDATGFRISTDEVSIGEYAEFLETLSLLAKEGAERTFDHPEQPKDKASHRPDNWEKLYPAAKQNLPWGGFPIDLGMSVVGVDWWDAYAFAKWKRCQLPTQEQWLAALMAGAKVPSAIPVSHWQTMSGENPDRIMNGLIGMAGSVSEWTLEPHPSPSNPLGAPLWVIAGGSFKNPGKGALTREWVADRSLRRPDLGFRMTKDPQ